MGEPRPAASGGEQPRPVALVTGISRGIGRATAVDLAGNGYDIVGFYASNERAARETGELVTALGAGYAAYKVDVANETQVRDGFRTCLAGTGRRLDAVVVSAGITGDSYAATMSADTFDRVIATNLRGAFLVVRSALRAMRRQGGAIVLVSSISGLSGQAGQINYSASKAGMHAMAQTLAKEGARLKIRVNAVAPGFTSTDMLANLDPRFLRDMVDRIPLQRVAEPSEVATVIRFLLSRDASYVTGQILAVDGGLMA